MIAILVAVGTGAAFIISTINDQSSLTVDKLLALFFGNNIPSRDFTLGNEAFQVGQMGTPIPVTARDLTLPELFTKVEKSVVQISSRSDSSIQSAARLGSGFIFDRNRHVITNYHVASGNKDIDVTFMDGNTYHANIVGSDPFTDLAVLYVQDVPKDTLFPLT